MKALALMIQGKYDLALKEITSYGEASSDSALATAICYSRLKQYAQAKMYLNIYFGYRELQEEAYDLNDYIAHRLKEELNA